MNQATYLSPSERFYRGEITREQARKLVLANARRSRNITGSRGLDRVLKVFAFLLIPLGALANYLASSRRT
jgi:hypothetical protein